ncbi:hypothetical protein [Paraclostridium sordellii]|uniref:DUF2726 domain-containing protein n=1 Tax=Paraclostridium sordellii TaxID=1505 RepID=A0A9P1P988_PARSO|nr:hypothetical protein [Paeniclostridium sordellii]CEO32973.1 Uncharacterised protein [[Clostridium] sordellii] [Paeniclostridium sordellii]
MVKRLTNEEYEKRLFEVYKGEYINIENYITKRTKIKFKHINCGTEFMSLPNDVLRGLKKCPKCMTIKLRRLHLKDPIQFKEEFDNIFKSEYELLSEYKNNRKKVSIKHNKCNYIFKATPNNLLSKKSGCPKCAGNQRKSLEQFKEKVLELENGEYEVYGEYLGNKSKILMYHKECKNYYETTPSHFIQGRRCTVCIESTGEAKLRKVLNKYHIKFLKQFRFKDCRGDKYPLPFDFALFKDNELLMLIEIDGEQHFKPINFNGIDNNRANELFNKTKKRDEIKNKYCEKNNIKLLRIPYFEFENIEKIITVNMGIPSEAE